MSREFSSRNWRHYSDDGKGPRPTYSSTANRSMTAEEKSLRQPPSAAACSAKQARSERAAALSVKKARVKSTSVVARKTEGHSGAPSSSQMRCSTTPRPSTSKPKSSASTARDTVRQGQKSDTDQQGQTARDSTAKSSNPGREVEPMETSQLPSTSSAPPPAQTQKAGNASRRGRKRGACPLHLLRRHFLRLGSVLSATIGSRTYDTSR